MVKLGRADPRTHQGRNRTILLQERGQLDTDTLLENIHEGHASRHLKTAVSHKPAGHFCCETKQKVCVHRLRNLPLPRRTFPPDWTRRSVTFDFILDNINACSVSGCKSRIYFHPLHFPLSSIPLHVQWMCYFRAGVSSSECPEQGKQQRWRRWFL